MKNSNTFTRIPNRNSLTPLLIITSAWLCLEYTTPTPMQNMNIGAAYGLPSIFPMINWYGIDISLLNTLTTIRACKNIMNMIDNAFAISSSVCLPIFTLFFENISFIKNNILLILLNYIFLDG